LTFPTRPIPLKRENSYNGVSSSIFVVGDLAYVSDGYDGLFIFEVTEKGIPSYPLIGFVTIGSIMGLMSNIKKKKKSKKELG